MKLDVYELIIDEEIEEESGVSAIALVDNPAIERDWQAFNKHKRQVFAVTNEEQRIVSGPLMVAGLPIYRNDERLGEHYVVFSADTIKKIVLKYSKQGLQNEVNKMHDPSAEANGVYLFESFIIDKARGIATPEGFDTLPEGSWFGSMKVDSPEIWEQVKNGTFKGFSVEGIFEHANKKTMEERTIDELLEILNA